MGVKAIIHRGTVCGNTLIDPNGIRFPKEVPVFNVFDRSTIIGKASGFEVVNGNVVASIELDAKHELAPAISGEIMKFDLVDGVRRVSEFRLHAIGLVPPGQTDTDPL